MLTTALAGALMAISLSAPPGPVTMETVRRGLGGGFRPALLVQLGSVIGDLTWCGVALLGLAPLVQIGWVRAGLSVAGVALLLYLGVTGLRDAVIASPATEALPAYHGGHAGAFRSGLAISMANPMAIGYWLSVGGALIAAEVAGSTPLQTGTFVGGYLGGPCPGASLSPWPSAGASVCCRRCPSAGSPLRAASLCCFSAWRWPPGFWAGAPDVAPRLHRIDVCYQHKE